MDIKNKVLEFLKTQTDCVIATVASDGRPQAATVGFAENERLELVFGTSRRSRKFQNITRDPRVAVTFGFSGAITVQYEGRASLLEGDALKKHQDIYFQRKPEALQYKDNPDQVYILIEPHWIRYTNYSKQPLEIEKLEQFA